MAVGVGLRFQYAFLPRFSIRVVLTSSIAKGFHQQALSKLSVRRTLTGSSQAHGLLTIVLRSNVEEEMDLVYLETVPWLLDFYVHSMHAHLNGTGRGTSSMKLFQVEARSNVNPR